MDIQEIRRYIEVGSGYIEVDRSYPEKYKGLCRRIYIRENKIQIDFCTEQDIELNEGETTFYFVYTSFEDVIKSAENFLKKPVSEWTNYNRTWNEWYFPQTDKDAYIKLWKDLQSHALDFPHGFSNFYINNHMARGVFLGLINPEDNFEWTVELFEKINELDRNFTEY
ncbi:MAG: hypothetical protein K2K91_12025 [Ruminococcus sp.]|nr:hypothetical protein [Ruminococcus sp.]MDE7097630.1 hypothetical protein [Ruminococcus sp.]